MENIQLITGDMRSDLLSLHLIHITKTLYGMKFLNIGTNYWYIWQKEQSDATNKEYISHAR